MSIFVIILFFGIFTPIYIIVEDTVRWFYRCKSQDLPLNFASWWFLLKSHHWHLATLWRAPLAIIGNGLIVFGLGLYMAFFAQPLMGIIGHNHLTGYLAILFLSGWSWHVIIPSIYARWIHDKSNKIALLFADKEPV